MWAEGMPRSMPLASLVGLRLLVVPGSGFRRLKMRSNASVLRSCGYSSCSVLS